MKQKLFFAFIFFILLVLFKIAIAEKQNLVGNVIDVAEGKVKIDLGKKDGIQFGMQGLVYYEITIVQAGEKKRKIVSISKVKVVSVEDDSSIVIPSEKGSPILAGYKIMFQGVEKPKEVTPPKLGSLVIVPDHLTIKAGGSTNFAYIAKNTEGNLMQIAPQWSVEGNIGSVDSSGVFTAKKVGNGKVVVSYQDIKATADVEVTLGEVKKLEISPATATVKVGETVKFVANILDDAGNSKEVTPTWSISGEIGQISSEGVLTAFGKGEGEVLATYQGFNASAKVVVAAGAPSKIKVNPSNIAIKVGETFKFSAIGEDLSGNPLNVNVTWETSDAMVGTIDGTGLFTALDTGELEVIAMATIPETGKTVQGKARVLVETQIVKDKILFCSKMDGNYEIYVMNVDGSGLTRLTRSRASDAHPSYSPDGKKIVFISNRDGNYEIYLMDADGNNQTRLTVNQYQDGHPKFSPDGRQIVFMSKREGNFDIYLMDSDGRNEIRLTDNEADDKNPCFSPDGDKIAFDTTRDGNSEIYIMNRDGSNPIRLTNEKQYDGYPSFSRFGDKIAFVSYRSGNAEIYIMGRDGSNQTQITHNGYINGYPSFSPNGDKIAFMSKRKDIYDIYVINVDGTGEKNLTNSNADNSSPSWSPR